MNEDDKESVGLQVEMIVAAWGSGLTQLVDASELPESEVIDAAKKGAVWVKRRKMHKLRRMRDLSEPMSIGDLVYLNYNAEVLAQKALEPVLIADEVNYSIWNKPAGMLSQGSKWSDHCTITQTVSEQHGKPTFLVHRLDKAAAGLIVVAHTKNAVKKMTDLFADRKVTKHYRVEVHGQVKGPLPIKLDANVQGKTALTDILEVEYNSKTDTSSLLVNIDTGRKHQIRDHLFGAGFPVVGDRLFDPDRKHEKDLSLTASKLVFECPFTNVKKQYEVKAG